MHIVTVARLFWVFGSLFLRRCGSGRLWSIVIYSGILIVCLVHYFFAVRTCYMPHPGAADTFRQKATLVRPNGNGQATGHTDAFILAKRHTFLRKQPQPMVHNQKAETTLRRSRGNLASCPGFGVFVWWRGLSVWSFVRRTTLSFTCDTSLNRGETCLLVLAALLVCRRSVASAVPSRLRPGFLGIYPLLSGRQPKNWPCTVLFLASLVEYLLWGVLDCVQCP